MEKIKKEKEEGKKMRLGMKKRVTVNRAINENRNGGGEGEGECDKYGETDKNRMIEDR